MATIYIDNKPHEVKDGHNLLQACLSLGFDIPHFCWHPALHSVGACRLCAVKQFRDENDAKGRIVMSCMTPASEGVRISIDDPEVKAFRAGVINLLMLNHPHDCPVCDEGGECHLQDMTVMTGHVHRRSRFKKRTHRNQDLGPFLDHEMNRCIQCYRCLRFYRDYAGGRDLEVFGSRNHVYFGRYEDGALENEFSGNLAELCPTGVFTDKTFRKHHTRKWDLQTAPSVCVHCGLGCNTIPGERYGKLRRIRNRYNGEVNGYFLCDRGRFGYEFSNSTPRIRQPLLGARKGGPTEVVSGETALQHTARLLRSGAGVIGIGSPRASLEANFVLRSLVGPDHFCTGMPEREAGMIAGIIEILRQGPARSPSLRDVAAADAVFVLGEDVVNTAPMLALALRQSARNRPMAMARKLQIPQWDDTAVREAVQGKKGPVFVATPHGTGLDDMATQTHRAAPDDLALLGFAVARELEPSAPPAAGVPEEIRSLAGRIALALKEAERPLVVAGPGCGSEALIQAAANIAWALGANGRQADLCLTVPDCNSLGLGLMGGMNLDQALGAVLAGKAETVVILENDLLRRTDPELAAKFFQKSGRIVVIDHCANKTTAKADVLLPAGTFAESDGTMVNNEGRAQRFFKVLAPTGEVRPSWQWLRDIMLAAGRNEAQKWQTLDNISEALGKALPDLEPIGKVAPKADFRMTGQKIPRQPQRYSGRTSMQANISVHEPQPPADPDSALAFSMEGTPNQPPSPLIPRFWAPGWNSVQAVNKFQAEIGGPLRGGDPGQRLIEPVAGKKVAFFDALPPAFERREQEWLIVPLYHIFGSEELSMLAPAVAERAPAPYLALHPDDADSLRIQEGEELELELNGSSRRLAAKYSASLPRGLAGFPAGLPGSDWTALPAWGRLKPLRKGE